MARHDVCSETEIPVGEMKRFKVGGEGVLIYHLEDGFYATQSTCTHTFGPLRMGKASRWMQDPMPNPCCAV